MLVQTDFAISKKLYAINPDTIQNRYTGDNHAGLPMYKVSIEAIWFRRKNGVEVASKGFLWDHAVGKEWTVEDFINEADTGRYGGSPIGSWDGEDVIGVTNYQAILELVKELDPILNAYPAIPQGYQGWYLMKDNI